MLVGWKNTTDPLIDTYARSRVFQWLDYKFSRILDKTGFQYCGLPFARLASPHPWIRRCHILQLYNLHGGYFDLKVLPRVSRKKHLIWRLSDLWAMSGHCAYPGKCERWKSGCGECPDLSTYPPVEMDQTRFLWTRKKKIYASIDSLTVVAPSSFTETAARQSPLFGGRNLLRIPNGVDTAKFRPLDQKAARLRLGIHDESSIGIVFVSHVAFANARKGTDLLMESLKHVKKRALFLVVGENSQAWGGRCPQQTFSFPFTKDASVLRDIINAGDIFVQPSTLENLPNTLLEGMSCGKPVVVFDRGGMRDAVENNLNGFCLKEPSAKSLSDALNYLLANNEARNKMGRASRKKALKTFSLNKEISAYEKLYNSL